MRGAYPAEMLVDWTRLWRYVLTTMRGFIALFAKVVWGNMLRRRNWFF